MTKRGDRPKRLATALEDYSVEGIAILTAEPSHLIRSLIYGLFALLVAGLVWSFMGKADVIMKASGRLGSEPEVRHVYAPFDGELVDIYMEAGTPVVKNDVLARVNSPAAIKVATLALEAQIKFRRTLEGFEQFLAQKKTMEHKLAALKAQIDDEEKAHQKRIQESLARLAEQQQAKLNKARANFNKAKSEMERAKRLWEKHERLFKSSDGTLISHQKVAEKRTEYQVKQANFQLAEIAIRDLTVNLNEEYVEKQREIQKKSENLENLHTQYQGQTKRLEEATALAETEVRIARLSAERIARVTFEDIDEDNYVLIKAPESGVLTDVAFTQRGDKVEAKEPLAKIVPADARMVVYIEILEHDRGFLREGVPVKVKFNAFPYQYYGVINGFLEYIAPSTIFDSEINQLIYKGRVRLERDHFIVGNVKFPLRFGMTASAEIVVQQRSIIKMALDPFIMDTGL